MQQQLLVMANAQAVANLCVVELLYAPEPIQQIRCAVPKTSY